MTESIPTIETRNGASVSAENPNVARRDHGVSPIKVTLALSVVFAVAYAAFQRIGTTANADTVEYTPNLSGGFLAVGMTKDQPGFIVLSALDQDKVDVDAAQTGSRLAGTHTIVEIQTPRGKTHVRLRGPQVILVTDQGEVEGHTVDWTAEDFNTLRKAADCSHEAAIKNHRCGAPFADLHETLAVWPGERVPESVRTFLTPYGAYWTRRNKNR